MGNQAGEQCVHKMLRGSSGLTLYLFLKAPFVISGFCIAEDPAAGLNHCIPIWAAHRNHPGGKTHTEPQGLLFAGGQVFQNSSVPVFLETQSWV